MITSNELTDLYNNYNLLSTGQKYQTYREFNISENDQEYLFKIYLDTATMFIYNKNKQLHYLNGPALISNNNCFYYIFGIEYTKEDYYEIINNKEKITNMINSEIIKNII